MHGRGWIKLDFFILDGLGVDMTYISGDGPNKTNMTFKMGLTTQLDLHR